MTNFDFNRIGRSPKTATGVDPIEIFRASAVTDQEVNDLWLGQGDALREWNKHRELRDIGVVLNTGAGKTLVGMLIAQSLVNETRQQVVYACSSIQLVEQTAQKAKGYGINVATYVRSEFEGGDAYFRADCPCITTYQALFNGKTIFRDHDLSAVIFDDAHTADQMLRDQFSLRISRDSFPNTYNELSALFAPYHTSTDRASTYAEICRGDSSRLLMIPPFEVTRHAQEIRRILSDAQLDGSNETKFAREHTIDHEDLCCWLISSREITLTPLSVPVSTLPYFSHDVRRVYLSATLSAPDAFAHAFGRIPERTVAPNTNAGECERMILIPSLIPNVASKLDIRAAQKIIADKKALIMVPSYARSEVWRDMVVPPPAVKVSEHLDTFRETQDSAKLILTARYDGIDLPGDTCRVLVLDDLPAGSGPLERFQRDSLNMDNSTRSTIASRIVQSFGRISRGMSDHGVVLLTGEDLVNWIRLPRNRSLLPMFLQNQIKLGEEISSMADTAEQLAAAMEACLERHPEWTRKYSEYMTNSSESGNDPNRETARDLALAEAAFAELLWRRDFAAAASALEKIQERAVQFSQSTGGLANVVVWLRPANGWRG